MKIPTLSDELMIMVVVHLLLSFPLFSSIGSCPISQLLMVPQSERRKKENTVNKYKTAPRQPSRAVESCPVHGLATLILWLFEDSAACSLCCLKLIGPSSSQVLSVNHRERQKCYHM